MLSILGDKLRLNEHSMRPRTTNPGDRLRGTLWTTSGQESTLAQSIDDLRQIERQILGLNDITSVVPIVSEQQPQMSGWHRILRAASTTREHARRTMLLDWEIQTLTVDAELELRLAGMTLPNEANLHGTPIVGLPLDARGVFFPSDDRASSISKEALADVNHNYVNRWQISDAAAVGGARFYIDADDASDGQCDLKLDGRSVIGLRPQNEFPSSWELNNGLVRVRNGAHILSRRGLIAIDFANFDAQGRAIGWKDGVAITPRMNLTASLISSSVSNLGGRFELVNIAQNEQHSISFILGYSTPHLGLRRDLVVNIRRGSRIVTFATTTPNFALSFSPSGTVAAPYVYRTNSWTAGTNKNSPQGSLTSGYLDIGRENCVGWVGPGVSSASAREALQREFLGVRGGFLNWVLK